ELAEAQRLAQLGSWRWDRKTREITWSEELYRIHGLDPKLPPMRDEQLQSLFTPESWERLRSAMPGGVEAGSVLALDLEIVRPDGNKRWITARGQAVLD